MWCVVCCRAPGGGRLAHGGGGVRPGVLLRRRRRHQLCAGGYPHSMKVQCGAGGRGRLSTFSLTSSVTRPTTSMTCYIIKTCHTHDTFTRLSIHFNWWTDIFCKVKLDSCLNKSNGCVCFIFVFGTCNSGRQFKGTPSTAPFVCRRSSHLAGRCFNIIKL